jgi:hypothetical protein
MKCITEYKKKVQELNDKQTVHSSRLDFQEYLKELNKLDIELLMSIRKEKNILVYSTIF